MKLRIIKYMTIFLVLSIVIYLFFMIRDIKPDIVLYDEEAQYLREYLGLKEENLFEGNKLVVKKLMNLENRIMKLEGLKSNHVP